MTAPSLMNQLIKSLTSSSRKKAQLRTAKIRQGRRLVVEALEDRQLMAADLDGTVFEDLDRNGRLSTGENGTPGWTVYLDLNKDGSFNTGEPSQVTNKDGTFQFKGLAAGNYRLAEIVQAGWVPTSPISQDIVHATTKNTVANFFDFSGGDIAGTVWNDLNNDGIRTTNASGSFTDPGLAGWTMFLDLNNNLKQDSTEPSTVTADDGTYAFRDLAAGDYEVTEILPAGWDAAKKNDIKQTATVVARKQIIADVGNVSLTNGSITGMVYNDLNADGTRDVDSTGSFTDPGLEGWTVFIDQNANNTLDAGEISTTTDATGTYRFLSLPAADYEVTEVLPAGWDVSPLNDVRQTVGVIGGNNSIANDFANFTVLNGSISGSAWNDVNRNSVRDFDTVKGVFTDPPLVGWTVFLDLNRNLLADAGEPTTATDTNGNYSFPNLQVGDYEVQEKLPAGWEVATAFSDAYTVTVTSGANSSAHDFANFNSSVFTPGSLAGVLWNDSNSNGLRDAGETGLTGWTVFLDQNSDGLLTTGEPTLSTASDGSYQFSGVTPGTVSVGVLPTVGWKGTSPASNSRTVALRNGIDMTGLDFGEVQLKDSTIQGTVFVDANKNGVFDASEHGLGGVTVYIDLNNNSAIDAGEPSTSSSVDQFYTPTVNEAGQFSFTHLAAGTYTIREVVSTLLSATPAAQLAQTVTIVGAEVRSGVNSGVVYRPNEIHGALYEDANGNHLREAGESPIAGTTVFVDLNRNNALDASEPSTTTAADGTYSFVNLSPGAYVVREVVVSGFEQTAPTTLGGILWPAGVSNLAVGNVTPTSITASLAPGQSLHQTVSITLPNTGALTNAVDVFLLFDDTGSFVNNSPIVRAAFPDIISKLQTSLPGIDLGFGAGRLEEYANFAYEYATGRPFILNQPIVVASTPGYLTSIQAALNRTTPGYGGDQPETDIEALYQLVTGRGFDGNNNGSTQDSGPAGLASTQLNPGISGDVPSFASFVADPANSVMPAAGNIGGAGFRSGALPIILLATDTGFAYQPKGETSITGVGGATLPLSSLTQTSRPSTPFNSGAGIQETITGLNALGALVIGLGTNADRVSDPRQQLESISKLTGATNQSTTAIPNGTATPIAPGDPLYFQIASGFGASVANGVVSAIQNAVTNVAVDIDVIASDPRVHIINHTGIAKSVGAGKTSTFDIEFVGDGVPRRFDLQFVRAGTSVVLGSIPVVLGTPVPGNGYEFDDLEDGDIATGDDFGNRTAASLPANVAPSFVKGTDKIVLEDAVPQHVFPWATAISPGPASESSQVVNFVVSTDNTALFSSLPDIAADGTLSFTPASNAFGTAIVTVVLHDNGGTANGGVDTSAPQKLTISVLPVNDAPIAVNDNYAAVEDTLLSGSAFGLLTNDSDIDSPTLTALLVSAPSNGKLTLNLDGSFSYMPMLNFNGSDSFTYVANDGFLNSNTVTVTLNVAAVNDAPVAANDSFAAVEDILLSTVAPGLLVNDSDIEGTSLTAGLVAGPSHGTLTLQADGSFSYLAFTNYNGVDSFTYLANDGVLNSVPATVTLTIAAVNDAPVAANDGFSTLQGQSLTVVAPGILKNDTDVDSTALTVKLVSGTSNGTLTLNPDGSFVYVPNATFVGTDQFSYVANDGLLDSNTTIVSITVNPISGGTKFIVVDGKNHSDFNYDANGAFVSTIGLSKENTAGRGIASSRDGSRSWIIDADGVVFVYDRNEKLIGSWEADGIDKPEGIASDDKGIWIVDRETNRVYFYANAATVTKGNLTPTSSFALDKSNQGPKDIVTDGSHLWVVNDGSKVDSVFRYSLSGKLEGSWNIDSRNASPTGITIDPNLVSHIWIVDAVTKSVFQYDTAVGRIAGSQISSKQFALAANDTDPQGIADPIPTASSTNLKHTTDVDDDSMATPLDALVLINAINSGKSGRLEEHVVGMPYLDVNNDGLLSPLDVLAVINDLNSRSTGSGANAIDSLDRAFEDFGDDDDSASDLSTELGEGEAMDSTISYFAKSLVKSSGQTLRRARR